MPPSKKRSWMWRWISAGSTGLSQRLRPSRMVAAWRPIAFTPSSELRLAMPCNVCRTSSIEPAFTSKFSHSSASVSSEESSEFSSFVAAVAARRFWMYRNEVELTMWPLMYLSQDAA